MNDSVGAAVVRLPVRFDSAAVETMRARLTAVVDEPGVHRYVVDGADVEDVSSSGLGLLIALRHAATVRGIEFVVDKASPSLAEAIEASGLGDRLLGRPVVAAYRATWAAGLAANA